MWTWRTIMADEYRVTRRDSNRRPSHPGALLREIVVPATKRSKSEIAALLGMSRQNLYAILEEKQSITPEVAVKLGKLFGNGPELWWNMQAAHDLWTARHEVDVSGIPTLEPA